MTDVQTASGEREWRLPRDGERRRAETEVLFAFDPPVDVERRLETVRVARNPLMEAAGPLLRMLADMPATMASQEEVRALRLLLAREVDQFQILCERANLHWIAHGGACATACAQRSTRRRTAHDGVAEVVSGA